MDVTVNIMSKTRGEVRKFLNSCFDTHMNDDDCIEWLYIYNKPKEAMDIINVFADNIEKFNASLWVKIGEYDVIAVNKHNKNRILNIVKEL